MTKCWLLITKNFIRVILDFSSLLVLPNSWIFHYRLALSPCNLRAKNLKAPGAVAAPATGEHPHSSNHGHPLSSSRTGIGAKGCSPTRGVLARPAAARDADWRGGAGKGGPSAPRGLPTPTETWGFPRELRGQKGRRWKGSFAPPRRTGFLRVAREPSSGRPADTPTSARRPPPPAPSLSNPEERLGGES